MSTKRHHILLVEDEENLLIGMKYNFEAEGYRVSTATDGATALQMLEGPDADFDLVVLDIMLPGASGYTVCETLREAGNEVPVLLLSARTLTEDRVRGFDLGADQYLTKPFELDELLSISRNLIQRRTRGQRAAPPKEPEGLFTFGDALVNFESFEVTVKDMPLRLTYMEMRLLRYFAEHEGLVVSRSELLENVWGLDGNPTTRTVDNFLVRLRKYFEQDPAHPKHFLSLRGAGYRFVRSPDKS